MKPFFFKINPVIAVLLGTLILMAGCTQKQINKKHPDWPAKIQIAYLPDEEQPGRRLDMYQKLESYLEQQLEIEVSVVRTSLYGPVVEAMRSGKIDVAFYSTFSYLLAAEKGAAESLVMRSEHDGSPRAYHAYILARPDGDIHSFEDMVSHAGSLVFSFVNPASTSGHLLPRAHMERQGFIPEKAFREVVYSGSQNASIYSVLSGKADVAAASSANVRKMLRTGSLEASDVRIIWKSPDIPAGCTAVRKSLPESLKVALRDAYLNIEAKDPALFESIQSIYREYLPEGSEPGSYIVCPDSTFDPLREIIGSLKQFDVFN